MYDWQKDKDKRLKWWRDSKFGLFIHWGLYAIPAGVWNGVTVPGASEWLMHTARIPVKDYEKLASRFNPVKFNADEWAEMAESFGVKYVVITAKHHDGFCLFDTELTDYSVVRGTPFGRDIIGELSKAVKKRGLKMGFYYSQTLDWHHPNGMGNEWDAGAEGKDFGDYFENYAKPQVGELIQKYDPDLLWFDIFTPTYEMARDLREYVYHKKPSLIVNGRIDPPTVGWNRDFGTLFGDYASVGDNEIPSSKLSYDWETPMTHNDSWGYKSADQNWKSAGKIVQTLITVVSRGGNLLLNVGPTKEGEIPRPSVEVLSEVGRWLKANGESVYATRPALTVPVLPYPATESDEALYVHLFGYPWAGSLELNGLKARGVRELSSGRDLRFTQSEKGISVELPTESVHRYDTVLAVEKRARGRCRSKVGTSPGVQLSRVRRGAPGVLRFFLLFSFLSRFCGEF